jgi:hypothetical protein
VHQHLASTSAMPSTPTMPPRPPYNLSTRLPTAASSTRTVTCNKSRASGSASTILFGAMARVSRAARLVIIILFRRLRMIRCRLVRSSCRMLQIHLRGRGVWAARVGAGRLLPRGRGLRRVLGHSRRGRKMGVGGWYQVGFCSVLV